MKNFRAFALGFTALTLSAGSVYAEPNVVTSIKPIHSLVANVMNGVGKPTLLMEGSASPHAYSLKPSQARQLANADVIFWVGDDIETFLKKPIATVAAKARSVEMLDTNGIIKLKLREDEGFEAHDHSAHAKHEEHEGHGHDEHDHDKHDHDKHDDHHKEHAGHDDHKGHDDHDHHKDHADHDKHDDHGHDHHKEEAHKEHDDHGHGHDHGEIDAHAWLDPKNAQAFTKAVAKELSALDPANAKAYQANAKKAVEKLELLTQSTHRELMNVQHRPYIVFHDAYQYFEKRFDIPASGAITLNPETPPSANRVKEVRHKITDAKASCVFAEPQFEPKIISVVTEGTTARSGILDPIGADIPAGPDHYATLIKNMAASLKNCLSS